jgi:hypothetical protein
MRKLILISCAAIIGVIDAFGAAGPRPSALPSEMKIENTLEVLQGGSFYSSRKLLCGPLCLCIGAKYLGLTQYSVDDIAKMADWDPGVGTTLLGLENACRSMGLDAQSLQFESVEQLGQIMRRNNALAIIEDVEHYYLFTKIGREQALVISTTLQPKWIPVKDLEKAWEGKALLFSKRPIQTGNSLVRVLFVGGLVGTLCTATVGCIHLARKRGGRRPGSVVPTQVG